MSRQDRIELILWFVFMLVIFPEIVFQPEWLVTEPYTGFDILKVWFFSVFCSAVYARIAFDGFFKK